MRRTHRNRPLLGNRAVVLVGTGLLLTALLNAEGLRKTATAQPAGMGRELALAATEPLVQVSHRLYLDRPRRQVLRLVGRGSADRIDETTSVAIPSGAGRTATWSAVTPSLRRRHGSRPAGAPKPRAAALPVQDDRPIPYPRTPLRVWVAGDSLVIVPGQSLQRAATRRNEHIDVIGVEGRLATGLTRPDVFNWFTRVGEVIAELRPDVAVLSFGSNDAHHLMTGVPTGRPLGGFGSSGWSEEYRRRVDGVTGALTRAGTYVVWLGLPRARSSNRNPRFRTINRIVRDVVADHDRATFVDTWALLADRRGRYAEYLAGVNGRRVRVRAKDGIHYEPAGGDLIVRAVLERLEPLVGSAGAGRGSR